jgi:hypothetical protein
MQSYRGLDIDSTVRGQTATSKYVCLLRCMESTCSCVGRCVCARARQFLLLDTASRHILHRYSICAARPQAAPSWEGERPSSTATVSTAEGVSCSRCFFRRGGRASPRGVESSWNPTYSNRQRGEEDCPSLRKGACFQARVTAVSSFWRVHVAR